MRSIEVEVIGYIMEKYPITEHWFRPGVKQVTKEWTLQDDFKFLPEDALDFLVDVLVISAWIIPLLMAGITSSTKSTFTPSPPTGRLSLHSVV
jgi:hypothetical protein